LVEIGAVLRTAVEQRQLNQAILSNPVRKEADGVLRVEVKPVMLKDELKYQFAYHREKKVTHENLDPEAALGRLLLLIPADFRQALLRTAEADFQILTSKKGKVTVLTRPATTARPDLAHNRAKQYLLTEGTPVPFLVELGVMTPDGRVLAKKYDKFKQLNRFLEMVEDVVPSLPVDRTLNIVDFGCGKSYLTFALYHYLEEVHHLALNVVGLDLKADVIDYCNKVADRLGYKHLRFCVGDIARYHDLDKVDMVVTLHACDTATDAALEKAVRWGATVILSVPCCQHELNPQVQNTVLQPLLKHGIFRERFAALATDAVRAQILEILGYKTQVLEFIDMEHTPKNLLIRAVKEPHVTDPQALVAAYVNFRDSLDIDPYLERALADLLTPKFHSS
jgi:SAM-dependent methyltransferase